MRNYQDMHNYCSDIDRCEDENNSIMKNDHAFPLLGALRQRTS